MEIMEGRIVFQNFKENSIVYVSERGNKSAAHIA
jgi:hypothetical protein